ncbi:hypothetical protein QVG61_00410 [Thiohalobacter sp. IOR34]|uniref:cupredoxin domain-containing protein n=1 Tax=Thiohalobacter sp. IOR34 TaxID=3057176 RepID=UPI0025AED654|nr:hypothetical protein [Thiohalobacter sp. IOR34]WJW75588.1 hypothetical protein QVG61_00410 [Thiohalobacter sp. IOR34]
MLSRASSLSLLLLLVAGAELAAAAEIRGQVALRHLGVLQGEAEVDGRRLISVALLPRSAAATGRPRTHVIRVRDGHFEPLYLAIRRGDRVRFVNQAGVYHELFSLSAAEPVHMRLGKSGAGANSERDFAMTGSWHLFCRIHSRSYARIDVLDAVRIQMIPAGGHFEFEGLEAGRWQLRVAGPGVETQHVEAVAMTSPPPLKLTLAVHGAPGAGQGLAAAPIAIEQLFPAEPDDRGSVGGRRGP